MAAINTNPQPRRLVRYKQLARQQILSTKNRYLRITLVYLGITAFCLIFCAVYELFSFGEHSDNMRMMFMTPLLGGAAPFGLLSALETPLKISRPAFNLWNSGLAVRTSGCLICGIIEISGRVCDYEYYYWVISGIMLLLALAYQLAVWRRNHLPIR